MKRTVYHILPRGRGWGCKVNGEWVVMANCASLLTKSDYVAVVKDHARSNWIDHGLASEVIVHVRRKNAKLGSASRIGKGKGSRTTYGRDPEKSKG